MSQWTHVTGMIRLDNLGHCMGPHSLEKASEIAKENVKKALGNTCTFYSSNEDWDKCSVPTGSEGSLQYETFFPINEEAGHSLNWGWISIWGDLRDFGEEDYQDLKNWFTLSMEKLENKDSKDMMAQFMIRDSILAIDIEGLPRRFLQYSCDEKLFEFFAEKKAE